jgi:DNA-binding transcriptional LysR family regulator
LTTFNTWPQMKQAVLAGFGSAVLWCFAADAEPALRRLAPPDPRHDCPLWLLHRAKAPPGPALQALIAFLHARLPARLVA